MNTKGLNDAGRLHPRSTIDSGIRGYRNRWDRNVMAVNDVSANAALEALAARKAIYQRKAKELDPLEQDDGNKWDRMQFAIEVCEAIEADIAKKNGAA